MYKLSAEFLGTLILVLFGCGAAVLGGESVDQLGIAIAFGLAIVAGAYSLGPLSGGHFDPAISLAGRPYPGSGSGTLSLRHPAPPDGLLS